MQQNLPKGVGFILLSALSIALFNLFAKLGLGVTFLPLFLFVRFFLPFLIILPFCLLLEKRKLIEKKNLHNQLLRGVVVFLMQLFIFLFLRSSSITSSVMMWNAAPIFIPIISRVLYGHKASKVTWYATIIGFLGVICILKPDQGMFDLHGLYGLIAAILVGYSQVLYGINALKQTRLQNLFFLYGFCSVVGVVVFFISWIFAGNHPIALTFDAALKGHHAIFFLFMSIASVCNQYFLAGAYGEARPISLAPFIYASVFFAGLLQWFVFHQPPDLLTVMGSILIILASFLKWSYFRKV